MSVTGISSTSFAQITPQPPISRRQQEDVDGRQLQEALQSGDLSGAQQAYNALAAFGPNNSGPFTDPTQAAAFKSLGQSIQSGDLASAQNEANAIGTQQVASDYKTYKHDVQLGNQAATQKAIANLEGDFWAQYGWQIQPPPTPQTTAGTGEGQPTPTASRISVTA